MKDTQLQRYLQPSMVTSLLPQISLNISEYTKHAFSAPIMYTLKSQIILINCC